MENIDDTFCIIASHGAHGIAILYKHKFTLKSWCYNEKELLSWSLHIEGLHSHLDLTQNGAGTLSTVVL